MFAPKITSLASQPRNASRLRLGFADDHRDARLVS